MRMIGILIGMCGTLVFLLPAFAGIFNFGNLAGTGLSLVLLFCCLFEKRLKMGGTAVRTCLHFVQAGYAVFLVIALFACVQMYMETQNLPAEDNAQTMIVLGCKAEGNRPSQMLAHRLRAAEAYLKAHPDIPVVVSGGQGSDEIITEAQCMKNWLVDHGIPAERIFTEEKSSSTRENLLYSREIITENHLPEKIIIVTNNFHSRRAAVIAGKLGYTYSSLSAKTTWWLFPTSVMREVFGIAWEWVRR